MVLLAAPVQGEWIAGYEGNDKRGLAHLTNLHRQQLGSDRQLHYWVTGSYLFYDIVETSGTTRVTSPGLGAGVVYKWFFPNMELGLGPGYEVRWESRELPSGFEIDETRQGPLVQGDLTYRFNPGTSLTLLASYSDPSEWLYTSGRYLVRLSDALRAGPEAGFQGNDDVEVVSYGGLVEIPYQDRTALQFRAGQARATYRGGIEEENPYFSFGIIRSFW